MEQDNTQTVKRHKKWGRDQDKRPWGRGKPLPIDEKSSHYEASKGAIKRYVSAKTKQLPIPLQSSVIDDFAFACKALGITQVSVIRPIILETIEKADCIKNGGTILSLAVEEEKERIKAAINELIQCYEIL